MTDTKVELNEENLGEVAGGDFLPDGSYMPNFYGDADKIAEQMQKQYADTKKVGGEGELFVNSGAGSKGSAGGGSGITNTNINSTQKVGQQGDRNSNSGSINM